MKRIRALKKKLKPPPPFNCASAAFKSLPSDKDFFEEGFQFKGGNRTTSVGKVAVKVISFQLVSNDKLRKLEKLNNLACFKS